ncbi:MAG: hypothetical protein ORN28_00335 [Rhodoferax sp.]|nr:hypothetical protein [Rhodoferax sp.]
MVAPAVAGVCTLPDPHAWLAHAPCPRRVIRPATGLPTYRRAQRADVRAVELRVYAAQAQTR